MKNLSTMLNWFTRHWEEIRESYCWYNTETRLLTNEEITKTRDYMFKHPEADLVIIINGTKWLRPQRTWGDLPEWFRSNDNSLDICKENNAFVFVNCLVPKYPKAEDHQYKKVENLEERKKLQEKAMKILTESYESAIKARERLIESAKEIAEKTGATLFIFERGK